MLGSIYTEYGNDDDVDTLVKVFLHTKANAIWSKTTLTTDSVGGAGVDPPTRKMSKSFLRSLVCQFIEISKQIELNC